MLVTIPNALSHLCILGPSHGRILRRRYDIWCVDRHVKILHPRHVLSPSRASPSMNHYSIRARPVGGMWRVASSGVSEEGCLLDRCGVRRARVRRRRLEALTPHSVPFFPLRPPGPSAEAAALSSTRRGKTPRTPAVPTMPGRGARRIPATCSRPGRHRCLTRRSWRRRWRALPAGKSPR